MKPNPPGLMVINFGRGFIEVGAKQTCGCGCAGFCSQCASADQEFNKSKPELAIKKYDRITAPGMFKIGCSQCLKLRALGPDLSYIPQRPQPAAGTFLSSGLACIASILPSAITRRCL